MDKEGTENVSQPNCDICGALAKGYHFGIVSCRACAAFFRRTVIENKSYQCRQNGECQIHQEARNVCRACRYQRCLQLGMNKNDVQLNRDPIGKRCERERQKKLENVIALNDDITSKSNFISVADITVESNMPIFNINQALESSNAQSSVTRRILEGYRIYQASQKSLYSIMYPNSTSNETFRVVKHSEYVEMERACLPLMLSMLNDWYQPFDALDSQLKVTVLKSFSVRFSLLTESFRTIRVFPIINGKFQGISLHYGQCINYAEVEKFFIEVPDLKTAVKSSKSVIDACQNTTLKMYNMKLRESEIASLLGIMLWNEVSHLGIENQTRNEIYAELHQDILENYGISDAGIRFGLLLDLINDINLIERYLGEYVAMAKVFNPHLIEVWDEG